MTWPRAHTSFNFSLILLHYASFQLVLFGFQDKFLEFEEYLSPLVPRWLVRSNWRPLQPFRHVYCKGTKLRNLDHLICYISCAQAFPLNKAPEHYFCSMFPRTMPLTTLMHGFSDLLPVNPGETSRPQSTLFLAMDRNISMWAALQVKKVVKPWQFPKLKPTWSNYSLWHVCFDLCYQNVYCNFPWWFLESPILLALTDESEEILGFFSGYTFSF